MKIKIFHNPSCKKSRLGLEKLKAIYGEVDIRNYMKLPPTPSEINEIVMKLNMPIASIVRTNEEYFRTMLKGKNFTHEEWVKIICENPRLLKRPIVVGHYKAVIAIPADLVETIR